MQSLTDLRKGIRETKVPVKDELTKTNKIWSRMNKHDL